MTRSLNERQFGDYLMEYRKPDMDMPRHQIIVWKPREGSIHPAGHKELPAGASGFHSYAGSMAWHPKSHQITGVHVEEEHRRQGLASEMWKWGQEMRPRPQHSPDRTDMGDAWARRVGGRLPRRQLNNLRGDT